MTSASKELRETAITGIVALTVRSESAALEKIVKCLLHHLSGTSFLFFFCTLSCCADDFLHFDWLHERRPRTSCKIKYTLKRTLTFLISLRKEKGSVSALGDDGAAASTKAYPINSMYE